jgi:hypothetical protein
MMIVLVVIVGAALAHISYPVTIILPFYEPENRLPEGIYIALPDLSCLPSRCKIANCPVICDVRCDELENFGKVGLPDHHQQRAAWLECV